MATHSSILAWKTPWTEEPGGLQGVGSQWVRQQSHKYRKNAVTHQGLKQNKNPFRIHLLSLYTRVWASESAQ